MNLPSFWERYRLLRTHYPHHMRLSCLLNAQELKRSIDWRHMSQRAH